MYAETQDRRGQAEEAATKEVLVADSRARLTPAQMVEHKLVSLLQRAPLLVSSLQAGRQRGPY